jgi:hypothetical protein
MPGYLCRGPAAMQPTAPAAVPPAISLSADLTEAPHPAVLPHRLGFRYLVRVFMIFPGTPAYYLTSVATDGTARRRSRRKGG